MTHALHTVRRQVAVNSFAVAILLDLEGVGQWHVVDAYGEVGFLGVEPLKHSEVTTGRWAVIYNPTNSAPLDGSAEILTGSVRRRDSACHAIKLSQPRGQASWLVFEGDTSTDLLSDDHVKGWTLVYAAQSRSAWAHLNKLS